MPHYLRMNRNERNDMNAPIKWTAHEREAVAAEALKLHNANPALTPYASAMRAQAAVLPASRQRPLHKTQPSAVEKWLTPIWREIRAVESKAATQADARRNAEALFIQGESGTLPEGVNIDGPQASETPADTTSADIAPAVAAPEVEPQQDNTQPVEADASADIQSALPNFEATASELHIHAADLKPKPKKSKPHSTRKQVHWRDDEKRKVAARTYSNLKAWPDMSQLEAMRKAQDSELPEDRRRDLPTWSLVKDWAEPMIEACALDERIEAARIAEERERETNAQRLHEADEQARKLALDRAVAERMNNLTFDDLIHALARRFGRAIAEGFNEGFRAAAMPSIEAPPPASALPPSPLTHDSQSPPRYVEPTRTRLPKVCVVGLLNQQAEDVKRAFLGAIEFVFVQSQKTGGSGGHGGAGMLTKGSHCDLVVSMVDYVGHDVDRSAKNLSVPFVRINGAVSALKRELRAWLDGHIALKAA